MPILKLKCKPRKLGSRCDERKNKRPEQEKQKEVRHLADKGKKLDSCQGLGPWGAEGTSPFPDHAKG